MAAPDSALPGTDPEPNSPSSAQRPTPAHTAYRLGYDRLLNGLALAAAGLALLITGAITLPAAEAGLRLVNLTANSEAGTHAQLTRIERTLRRMARADSWSSQERKVKYPSYFRRGRDLVMEAISVESLGRLDSALKLSLMAETAYDQALASLNDTTEDWALGWQLRDWAEFNTNRVAQKNAMSKSFRIQIAASWIAAVFGSFILTLGLIGAVAAGIRPRRGNPAAADAPTTSLAKAVDSAGSTPKGQTIDASTSSRMSQGQVERLVQCDNGVSEAQASSLPSGQAAAASEGREIAEPSTQVAEAEPTLPTSDRNSDDAMKNH